MAARTWRYGLTANILVLGVVSLLTDFSSEMIIPILPFYLIAALGANALIVGFIEGTADAVVAFMKVVSGRWSDVAGKRKRFVEAGYGLSTVMKILFPFAQSWPQFFGLRIAERLGKGVRDAPRDALLTESTPSDARGKAFGFHRSMDTAGGSIGPRRTLILLPPPPPLWSRGAAFPAGILSDRVGRTPVILVGDGAFVAMGVLLAAPPNLVTLVLGFILYGLSYGMAEGTQRALVADLAPKESKATVLGAYHTSTGFVKLASGIVAGLLWVTPSLGGPAATFWFGAAVAAIAAVLLSLWRAPATSGASAQGPSRPA